MKLALAITMAALFVGTLAVTASTAPDHTDAAKVADRLDALTQPRFLLSMGQFGEDRVGYPSFNGHPRVSLMAGETSSEERAERRIARMRHPYILAMLHCAHRPGKFGSGDRADDASDKGIDIISCASSTGSAAQNDYDWAFQHLDKLTHPFVPQVKRGDDVEAVEGKWLLVIRPVKAADKSCITCHKGSKPGDTLGGMVYMVHLKAASTDVDHYSPDSGDGGGD